MGLHDNNLRESFHRKKKSFLKAGLSPCKKVAFICFNESPLKLIKKYFLFYVKSSFHFCPGFLLMWKNDLMRKLRLISKFMTSQTGQQIIATHILPNI